MEYLKETAVGTAPLRSTVWIRYVDDTCILWPHQVAVQIPQNAKLSQTFNPVHDGRRKQ